VKQPQGIWDWCCISLLTVGLLLLSYNQIQLTTHPLEVKGKSQVRRSNAQGVVSYEWMVTNCSHEAIRLLGANSDCSCMVVLDSFPMELNAGQSAPVKVNFKPTEGSSGEPSRYRVVLLLDAGLPAFGLPLTVVNQVSDDGIRSYHLTGE
jgi:hypothetical protein